MAGSIANPVLIIVVGYIAILCFAIGLCTFATALAYMNVTRQKNVPLLKSVIMAVIVTTSAFGIAFLATETLPGWAANTAFYASLIICGFLGKAFGKYHVSKTNCKEP